MKTWPLRIIYYLTGFLMLSSIHCLIVGIVSGGNTETFLHSMVYLPVIILLSEGQKKSRYFWQYALCVSGALAIARITLDVMTDGEFEKVLGTVLAAGAAAIYFYARAKKAECLLEAPEYYYLGLYLIMWFLERQYPSDLLEKYAVIGAGCYCLLCMYKTNIDEVLQFVDINEHLERFPEKRLLKSNLLMMGFQTAIVGCGMGMILSTGVDGIFDRNVKVLQRFLAWLLSFLESEVQHTGSEVSGGEMIMPVVEAQEQSAFMEMLLKVLDILSWALVIGLTLFAVFKVLKKIYQLYLEFDINAADNGDEIEKIYTVQSREEKRKLGERRAKSFRKDRSPNAKIRRYYKKRVIYDWKEAPKSSMTPTEIEMAVIMEEKKKKIFHEYYEKARYGNEPCTKEEMENYLRL